MKYSVYILCFLLCACKSQKEDLKDNSAIFGNWKAGQTPVIRAVFFDGSEVGDALNHQFELEFADGERATFSQVEDEYVLQSSRVPLPGERVMLRWFLDSDTAFALVEFPPKPLFGNTLPDTLAVTQSQNALINWDVSGEYEFALQLQCLEENPVPLPISPGNFEAQFAGPQVSNQLSLSAESFSYFGYHRLTVTVLNDDLLDVFFFDPSDIRGLLENGPDNVVGARGFITGISTNERIVKVE
jgi:hypothetical protein